jgi:chromate reductase
VLGISGSLRRDSHNAAVLRCAAELAPTGIEIELWDGLKAIPPYDADDDTESPPEPVRQLRQAIADADGLLFATPEYNSSIPGVLKNAIDWASRPRESTPLQGKPAAVVGATTGQFGAVWAQAELRKVLGSTGSRVIDLELPVAKGNVQLVQHGRLLTGDLVGRRCDEILSALIAEIERDRAPARAAA